MLEALLNLDGNILLWIQNNLRNDILTPVFKVITHFGDAGFIWILIAVLLVIFHKKEEGITVALALVLMLILNNLVLKELFNRTRPYEVVEGLVTVGGMVEHSPSFPSGHTASSFAAAIVIFLKLPKKFGISAFALAGTIAFTRLYIGVHYPTDILGGMVTGFACGCLAIFIVELVEKRIAEQKREE